MPKIGEHGGTENRARAWNDYRTTWNSSAGPRSGSKMIFPA